MEIKLYIKGHIYVILFGHKMPWVQSSYFITITEEFYDDPDYPFRISYAKMIYGGFRKKCNK